MKETEKWLFGANWWPPAFRLPVDNSLVNVFRDMKKIGFEFQLKWPVGTIFSSINLIERFELAVDGRSLPQCDVYLLVKKHKINVGDLSKTNLTFDPVEVITVGAEMANGLDKGIHELHLTVAFSGSPGPAVKTYFKLELCEK